MQLEEDNFYLLENGTITKNDLATRLVRMFENNNKPVAHIPKQLLNHLIVEINNYHTDSDFRKVVDNVWGK